MGGVLCRPLRRHRCRDQRRKHGVSDPGARAGNGPARVRRGRSRHGCRCPVSVVRASVVGPGIAPNQVHMCARNGTQIFRTIRSRSCGKSWSRTALVRCPLRSAKRVNNHGHVGGAGHHAIDVRSVLGTVQGSSLRSARACARPAGLDDACAQIGLGHYVMAGGVRRCVRAITFGGAAEW